MYSTKSLNEITNGKRLNFSAHKWLWWESSQNGRTQNLSTNTISIKTKQSDNK